MLGVSFASSGLLAFVSRKSGEGWRKRLEELHEQTWSAWAAEAEEE